SLVIPLALLCRAEKFLEERRINLRAAVVMRADVIEIRAVRQGVLRDDINIAAVKVLVLQRLAFVRDEALAKNRVRRTETTRVRAAVQYRILGHLRVQRLAVRPFERWREHIMAEPIPKPMSALLIVRPVRHDGVDWHQGEK